MKKILFIILVLFTQVVSAEIALYTSESETPHAISEMGDILEKFTKESPDKNIVFYVHGRNHYMEKEWDKLSVLESSYNVKVVMLHWDAWSSFLSRAVANADLTAEPLAQSFVEIRNFKDTHRDFFAYHSINLLCHSMGNLVLKDFTEKFIDQDQYNLETPLFENYISASADVPLVDHRLWLSRFNLAKNKNVVMNNRDIVLLLSYVLDLKDKDPFHYRLGLGFDNYPGKRDDIKTKLVPEATYIDLSGVLGSQHGYYMPKTPVMQNVFSKLLNGGKFKMAAEEEKFLKIKVKDTNNIVYVQDK